MLSILKNEGTPIFLDTSVLINLVVADCIEEMPTALNCPLLISEHVLKEFTHDPRDNSDGRPIVENLIKTGIVKIASFSPIQNDLFFDFVGALPPDGLGDGEAGTLACAIDSGFAAIDEKKARKIATRDFPALKLCFTLDLLCAPRSYKFWGEAVVNNFVRLAKIKGRMRVPNEWEKAVKPLLLPDHLNF
jgi:predicted nucleic acid-binding protein